MAEVTRSHPYFTVELADVRWLPDEERVVAAGSLLGDLPFVALYEIRDGTIAGVGGYLWTVSCWR
jgi:hypothetical protein